MSFCGSRALLAGVVVVCCVGDTFGQAVWYVDDSATNGLDSGLSWEDAFVDFQSALDVCTNGDEVRVAGGVYRPSVMFYEGVGRSETFLLVGGVTYLGGYAGLANVAEPGSRDISNYESVFSGDIGVAGKMPDNCAHVLFCVDWSGDSVPTVVNGFTVRDGYADPSVDVAWGGGMLVFGDDNVAVRNCRFENNVAAGGVSDMAAVGGAMTMVNAEIKIEGCTFVDNSVESGEAGATVRGGAVCGYLCQTEISDSRFINNTATVLNGTAWEDSYAYGGAVTCMGGEVKLRRCYFLENRVRGIGSNRCGYVEAYGGAVGYDAGRVDISGCVFASNCAESTTEALDWVQNSYSAGGALFSDYDRLVVRNSLFVRNKAVAGLVGRVGDVQAWGGAVDCSSRADIENSSFVDNEAVVDVGYEHYWAQSRGGALHYRGGTPDNRGVVNCVFWGNRAAGPSVLGPQVYGSSAVSYCCVQGGYAGEGNISLNPKLGPDGHVQAGSPCIDAGDSGAVDVEAVLDLAGYARLVDDPSVVDTGLGDGAVVDMGAYEYQPAGPVFAADLDRDGDVDLADFAIFEGQFGGPM